MKLTLFIILICFLGFAFSSVAQEKEPKKIREFGLETCDYTQERLDVLLSEMLENPNLQAYIISYDGYYISPNKKKQIIWQWGLPRIYFFKGYIKARQQDKPLEIYDASGVKKILDFSKVDESKITYINGGYREKYSVELWIIPANGKLPKATPTVDPKDKKFKGFKINKKSTVCIEGDGY